MPIIKFTDVTSLVPEFYYPTPAKKALPKWLVKLSPYSDTNNPEDNMTAKRCLPLLDAAMFGYTLYTTMDITVIQTGDLPFYKWAEGPGIEFHPPQQISTHKMSHRPAPKWINPWSIETPLGYSCFFTPPINNDSSPFTVFSGIVETDKYFNPVNLPFILTDSNFEGLVEAGTPICQVVPFKRENWLMQIEIGTNDKIQKSNALMKSKFKGAYRKFVRLRTTFD